MIWVTGSGLVISLLMITGLLLLVLYQGVTTFWPHPVPMFVLKDGKAYMGEVTRVEKFQPSGMTVRDEETQRRRLVRTGNFEITNEHFKWISDSEISVLSEPEWALVLERVEWGRFYGFPKRFEIDGKVVAEEPGKIWEKYNEYHREVRDRWRERRKLETKDIGKVNAVLEKARLEMKKAELDHGLSSLVYQEMASQFRRAEVFASGEFARIRNEIEELNKANAKYLMILGTVGDVEKAVRLDDIVRSYPANRVGLAGRIKIYLARWAEFLTDEPREANSEGGVYPAIFGTVVMTILMSLAVVPFGVMAALYLREYARAGALISLVRISINNLAGVPSIVYGVFGLGFFCYVVGASLDQLLFAAKLPNPTFGKGGVLWAALTLALLTLPVVIVATEESLAAVPNSMREGSYACGASKWQTLKRIVLPRAMPGIMTGMILAMARGAGEVAPLMLVGAVKLAPKLPLDGVFPYIHPERSFMHLGFHIYDLGFQSQNSEAAKPMVFTTTLLLIAIVFLLNVLAVRLRTKLRKKFISSAF